MPTKHLDNGVMAVSSLHSAWGLTKMGLRWLYVHTKTLYRRSVYPQEGSGTNPWWTPGESCILFQHEVGELTKFSLVPSLRKPHSHQHLLFSLYQRKKESNEDILSKNS